MATTQLSQRDKIANYLKAGNTISSMEAFRKFRITRLSGIIHVLIHERGMKVKSIEVQNKSSRYSVYYMGKKPSL